jgi:hypothetical protein
MSGGAALVRISVAKAVIEISGSEAFVKAQAEQLEVAAKLTEFLRLQADEEADRAKLAIDEARDFMKAVVALLQKAEEQREQALRLLAT